MRIGILSRLGFLGFFILGMAQLPAQVNVTKTDSLIYDANGNLLANPGDSLRYKTKVKNPGAGNVTGATMDVNPSANLGPATNFRTTPVAVNDTFAVTANIGITVPAGSGLKINDFDDNLALATLQVQVNQPTAMGGTVSVNADGSFTYVPAAGFTGADNFTYVLEDGNEVAGCPPFNHAVVTLNVAAAAPAMIWFIDNSSIAATSDGRLNTPFKTIADFNASAGPQPGHIVFLENTGTNYTGSINLKNNQTLWGSGHTGGSNLADLITEAPNSFTLPPINTTRPIIGSATNGILLAIGNSIRGLNIGNCTAFGIDDNGGTVGTLTISELNITNASGGGFRASDGGTLAVTLGSLSSTGGPNGIHLGSCGGSFNGGSGTITSPNGIAVNINGGTVGLTYSGSITQGNNFPMVSVSGGHNTGTVTFQTGTLSATNGAGLQFDNADSPTSYNFLGTTTLNGGAAAVNIINGSAGTFTFGANTSITNPADTAFAVIGGTAAVTYSGNITQANNFPMVSVSGGHTTGTITFNTGTLNATNGSGLQFDNADSPTSYNFNGAVSLNGGNAGIDIVNGSVGSFTFANCIIINPGGDAFELTNSNAIVSFTGVIRDNTDYAIDIDNHDANTVTFQGDSILSTGTGVRVLNSNGGTVNFNHNLKRLTTSTSTAVDLTTNNGGMMNFGNGGLAITTTSGIGFNATGGGTVSVTGSGNTVSSGTGTALNVTSTNIANSDLNFRSIAHNGGTTGIILNATGASGGLKVTGTGSANSGGIIQNTSGVGISMTTTSNVSLNWMQVANTGSHGISGTSMTDGSAGAEATFEILNSLLNSPGDGDNESALYFDALGVTNITGRLDVMDCTIQNFEDVGIHVGNIDNTLTVNVDDVTINNNSDTNGEEGVDIDASGTATINVNITDSRFQDLEGGSMNVVSQGSGTIDLNVNNIVDIGAGGPDNFPTPPVMTFSAEGTSSNFFFDITNNRLLDVPGDGIFIGHEGEIMGRVTGNIITGVALGDGIRIDTDITSTQTSTILIQNNQIGVLHNFESVNYSGIGDDGIQVLHRDGPKLLNLTIDANTIANTVSEAVRYFADDDVAGGGPENSLKISGNTFTSIGDPNTVVVISQDNGTNVCTNITGNTLTTGNMGIFLQQSTGTATLQITQASIAALQAANDGGAAVASTSGTITFNGTCINPPLPTN